MTGKAKAMKLFIILSTSVGMCCACWHLLHTIHQNIAWELLIWTNSLILLMKKLKLRNFKQSVTQESWYFNQCNLSRARIRMGPYTGILLVWSAIIKTRILYFGIQQSSVILLSLLYIHLGQLHLPPTTSTIISPLTIHKSVFPVLSNFILVQIYMSNCSL